jgi:sugar lactone lactonase YvrE
METKRTSSRLPLRAIMPFVLLVIIAATICGVSAVLIVRSIQGERQEPHIVDLQGSTVETLVELPDGDAYPEAITVGADGYLYSGSFCTGELWRISPEGELETWLSDGINAASGMVFAEDGTLYVVDREDCNPTNSVSTLKRVLPDKTVETWGEVSDDEILNGLAYADGILYATDTQLGDVRAFDSEGGVTIWWELPEDPKKAQPTGITYDEANNALLVADSANGIIYRVPIESDGAAGEAVVLYEDASHALDGLTLDDEGRLIFTSYDENAVLRLESNGSATKLAEDFRNPSDVAYLDGRVFVTNFDSISLAPVVGWILNPSRPFTIDVIDLREVVETPQPE